MRKLLMGAVSALAVSLVAYGGSFAQTSKTTVPSGASSAQTGTSATQASLKGATVTDAENAPVGVVVGTVPSKGQQASQELIIQLQGTGKQVAVQPDQIKTMAANKVQLKELTKAELEGMQAYEGAGTEATGELPAGTLAQERQGAIGTTPKAAVQGGAEETSEAPSGVPEGKLPEGSLAKERQGAIGTTPKPVEQK